MINVKKLPDDIQQRLPLLKELEADMRIAAMYLFGSAALDDLRPLSDIDVAVLLDNKYAFVRNALNILT